MTKKHRKRKWLGIRELPPRWGRYELKEEKIKASDSSCDWCGEEKDEMELELHHLDWSEDESAYVMVWVPRGEGYICKREHRDGYGVVNTRIVCRDCHVVIHRNPKEAERRGFKREKRKEH